jgi:hypothetical protein
MIKAPDRETAVRIQRVLGAPCAFVNDTLLEYRGAIVPPAQRKALTEEGLFLGGATEVTGPTEAPEEEQ